LQLAYNNLGPSGAECLADALEHNKVEFRRCFIHIQISSVDTY